MRGILDQRERMNLPAGMSELDLINYSPVLYELYRNEGQGFDNDAFRYDPVVSTGMLASDYELAKGLAWVNYLTPESQGAINPGDNLIVPVQTFDNYKNLPPWEKKLSHEVSYTGKNMESKYSANLLNLEASKVGMKNNFVGDFSYYFDKESRLLGTEKLATEIIPPSTPITPRPSLYPNATIVPVKPRATASLSAVSSTPGLVATTTTTTTGGSPVSAGVGSGTFSAGGGVSVSPGSLPSGSSDSGTSGGGEVISGGYLPSGGGAMSSGDTGSGQEMPEGGTTDTQQQESTGGDVKKITQVECKINYIPVIIGLIVLAIIGYAIAKQKKKDIKTFSIVGAVVGAILGYVYAKHQCNPIEALNKVGIKSKIESNYYGGR